MSKQEFIKNNRGIDEGKDLPEEMLSAVFDEISSNEIIMKDEKPKVAAAQEKSILEVISAPQEALFGKPVVENLAGASDNMALKTEVKFVN
jgi:brefeldin A-inhibited guanine nucleotide-exchange protein